LFHSDDVSYQAAETDLIFEESIDELVEATPFNPPISPTYIDDHKITANDEKEIWQPYIMIFEKKEGGKPIVCVNMTRCHPSEAAELNMIALNHVINLKENYKKLVYKKKKKKVDDDTLFIEKLLKNYKKKSYLTKAKKCRASDLLNEYVFNPQKTIGTRVYVRGRSLAQKIKQILRNYVQAFCTLDRVDDEIKDQIIEDLKEIINKFSDKLPPAQQAIVKYNYINYN